MALRWPWSTRPSWLGHHPGATDGKTHIINPQDEKPSVANDNADDKAEGEEEARRPMGPAKAEILSKQQKKNQKKRDKKKFKNARDRTGPGKHLHPESTANLSKVKHL